AKLREEMNFEFVTEISDPRQIDVLDPITSVYQVGTRNMYNYELLKELGRLGKPVMLKRGFSATVKEWLGATNYLSDLGEDKVILCERGIRTFENTMRNTLDLGSVIYLKENTNFKVIVDPSHAMGDSKYVHQASMASMAAGADGILVEVHPEPAKALSDGHQTIDLKQFSQLTNDLRDLAKVMKKDFVM
ncbi:MAG: N-acetylneuraminate synthase family protein, partial [Bacteriovoracaceae bacterium]|nr:N-acetylneuraminate synthase family protein [Bacteriovoracaceae bacterium]